MDICTRVKKIRLEIRLKAKRTRYAVEKYVGRISNERGKERREKTIW